MLLSGRVNQVYLLVEKRARWLEGSIPVSPIDVVLGWNRLAVALTQSHLQTSTFPNDKMTFR